jgi:hypothetical protein
MDRGEPLPVGVVGHWVRDGGIVVLYDPTAPPCGGADDQGIPVVDPTAPPCGGTADRGGPVIESRDE